MTGFTFTLSVSAEAAQGVRKAGCWKRLILNACPKPLMILREFPSRQESVREGRFTPDSASPQIWVRSPLRRRVLRKLHVHPDCASREAGDHLQLLSRCIHH